jgi:hypothetical protein
VQFVQNFPHRRFVVPVREHRHNLGIVFAVKNIKHVIGGLVNDMYRAAVDVQNYIHIVQLEFMDIHVSPFTKKLSPFAGRRGTFSYGLLLADLITDGAGCFARRLT